MNITTFKKAFEDSGSSNVSFHLQAGSTQSRRISRDNFIFYDEVVQYLVTMMSASIGKFTVIGGTLQVGPLDVNFIGRALDEEIYFPGIPLLWANTLGIPVAELEIDTRAVPQSGKNPKPAHVPMRDVGAKADTILFLQSFEKAKDQITAKFGAGWFKNWPESFRFAYLVRNACAHDGRWEIQPQKGKEHYQTEVFRWPRANLAIRMRDVHGTKVDEGRSVLENLNGVDFVVLLFEMNDALC